MFLIISFFLLVVLLGIAAEHRRRASAALRCLQADHEMRPRHGWEIPRTTFEPGPFRDEDGILDPEIYV